MHYKTRTYLDEAVEVRSTGFDMNEVWSMYAKILFWSCGSLARDLYRIVQGRVTRKGHLRDADCHNFVNI